MVAPLSRRHKQKKKIIYDYIVKVVTKLFHADQLLALEKKCVCDIKIPGLIYYEKVDQTSLLQDKYFYFVKLGANVSLLVVIDVDPAPQLALFTV